MTSRSILSIPPPPAFENNPELTQWCAQIAGEFQRLAADLAQQVTQLKVQYNGADVGNFDELQFTDPNGCIICTDVGNSVVDLDLTAATCP